MAWMVLEGGRVVEGRWRGAPPPPLPSPPSPPSTRLTAIGLPEDFSSSIVAAMEETQVNTDMAKRAIVDKQLKMRHVELARGLNTFLQNWAKDTMNRPILFDEDSASADSQIHAAARDLIDNTKQMDGVLHGDEGSNPQTESSGFYKELMEALSKTQAVDKGTLALAQKAELRALALEEELKALQSTKPESQTAEEHDAQVEAVKLEVKEAEESVKTLDKSIATQANIGEADVELALKKQARTEIMEAANGDAAAGQKVTEAVEAAAEDAVMQGAVAEALAEDAAAETKKELAEVDAEAAKQAGVVQQVEGFFTGVKQQKQEMEDQLGAQEEKVESALTEAKSAQEEKLEAALSEAKSAQEEKLQSALSEAKSAQEEKLESVLSEAKSAHEQQLNATQAQLAAQAAQAAQAKEEMAAAMAEETDRLKKEMEDMRSVQTLEAKQAAKSGNLMAVVGVFLLLIVGSLGVVLYRMANSVNVAVAKGASSVEQRNKEMLDKKKRVDGEVKLANSKDRLKRLNDNLSHMSRNTPAPQVHV